MKTILYMGITPNGYIAKENGDSEWTSEQDLAGFYANSKAAGNIIMGKNTFKELVKQNQFPFPDVLNVVMSHEDVENTWGEKVIFSDASPQEILQIVQDKGFEIAFIAGGGRINSSFITANLIDEIFFDIEPLLFARGIPVFAQADFEVELKLLETKKLNDDTVQLHYKVIK